MQLECRTLILRRTDSFDDEMNMNRCCMPVKKAGSSPALIFLPSGII